MSDQNQGNTPPAPAPGDPPPAAAAPAPGANPEKMAEAVASAQKAAADIGKGAGAADAGTEKATQEALKTAQEAVATAKDAGAKPAEQGDGAAPLELPAFEATTEKTGAAAIELLADVNLQVKIELGRTRMLVEDVLKLGAGSVVELDKLAGDPVDVYVNDRPVARGEVLVLNDNFCVRINEIIAQDGND